MRKPNEANTKAHTCCPLHLTGLFLKENETSSLTGSYLLAPPLEFLQVPHDIVTTGPQKQPTQLFRSFTFLARNFGTTLFAIVARAEKTPDEGRNAGSRTCFMAQFEILSQGN